MLEKELQERLALGFGQAVEAHGVGDVDVQRLATGLRMRAHDRMHGFEVVAIFAASVRMRSSRVLDTSALAELFTARSPSSIALMPSDNVS